jgi:transmembrane sensor
MSREDWLRSADPRRAAAAWHALMDTGEPAESDRAALADWLQQSPAHVSEFLKIGAVREQLADPQAFAGISPEQLADRREGNVEHLGVAGETPSAKRASRGGPRLTWAIAASALLACVGWLVWRESLPGRDSYATATGEQRSVVLADGSIAELNTRSQLKLHFTPQAREVALVDGEALFRVAKDASRPFRVVSGDTVVQAIGTAFTVRRAGSRTVVTVVEGRVSVTRSPQAPVAGALPPRVEMGAGERIEVGVADSVRPLSVEKVEVDAALAWRERRLILDDLALEAVVAEFNRYNARQIHLQGGSFEVGSITGVFDANDPDSFVSFLERRGDVSVSRDERGDVLLRAAE